MFELDSNRSLQAQRTPSRTKIRMVNRMKSDKQLTVGLGFGKGTAIQMIWAVPGTNKKHT